MQWGDPRKVGIAFHSTFLENAGWRGGDARVLPVEDGEVALAPTEQHVAAVNLLMALLAALLEAVEEVRMQNV